MRKVLEAEVITHDNQESWLKSRSRGIGASESAIILGLNPFDHPIDLWARKTGNSPPIEESEKMHFGHVFEGPIAEEYSRVNGVKFVDLKMPIIMNPKEPWFLCSPDRIIAGKLAGLEVKNVSDRALDATYPNSEPIWGAPGTDEIPVSYLIQCQHCLAVTGFEYWDLAVVFGGQHYRQYHIEPDLELHEQIKTACNNFWYNHVQPLVPPPAGNATVEVMQNYLAKRYAKNNGNFLAANIGEVTFEVERLKNAIIDLRLAETNLIDSQNAVKALIGDYDGLEFVEGDSLKRISWERCKDGKRVDWKELALSLKPAAELIKKFSKIVPGSRRFFVPMDWYKDEEGVNNE